MIHHIIIGLSSMYPDSGTARDAQSFHFGTSSTSRNRRDKNSTTIKLIGVWLLKLWQEKIADKQKNTIFAE
ncbi:hypothetical protein [Parabacteroides merdae]|uniref:hypothetical protein n=1 Tax=Parabacteroides merdae TaxID=46503 RepID=UPI0035644E0B